MSKLSRREFLKSMGWGAAASVGMVAYGDQTSKQVEIVERDLTLPNWDADGFRVGVITDLHLDSSEATTRGQASVRDVIARKPDAVVLVGDFLTSAAPQNLENVKQTLAILNDYSIPSYGVLGNHDYW